MDLNQQVARNTKLSINATAEQRRNFAEKNRAIRAEQGLLRIQQQRSSLHLANLKQEARETRNASNATSGLTRATRGLGGAFAAVGAGLVARELFQVGANSVQASVKVEGFRNSLTALYGDAQVANRVLADLQELSLLPGITFESAVQGAVRLKTVGVEGARAEAVIREFGNAAALAGASSDEVGRSLVGLTQILSRGKISQEELNQILENVPLIGNSIREAFGSIDAEVIRGKLETAGQSVQDFVDILVKQLSEGARASADSTRNAFSNLENATFRLHAAIGDRLSPSVREATGFLTDLANTTADFVAGTNDAIRSATSYAAALMMASNAAAVNSAIQERIEFLRQEKVAHDEAAEGRRNYFRFRGRDTDAGTEYKEITKEIGELAAAFNNTAAAAEHFRNVQNQLISEARDITQEITDLGEKGANQTARALGRTSQAIRAQREALAETQKEIGENAVVLKVLASANTTATVATEKTTEATKETTEATKEATVEIITYAEAIRQVQANIAAYVEEQALLTDFGDFWRVASGETEEYTTAIDLATASVVDHQTELETLTNAGFFDGLDDPIADYVAALEATSDAADDAFGSLNQVGEAVGDADFETAAAELRDFDDAFQLSEATIPSVTSAMREFSGTAPDIEKVERAVVTTTQSVDDLLDSIERVPPELDEVGDSADRAERGILNLERAFGDLGSNIIDFVLDIGSGGGVVEAFVDLGLNVGGAFVDEFEGVLNDRLSNAVIAALEGEGAGAAAGGAGSSIAASLASALTPVAVLAGSIYTLANVVDGFVGAVEFEGREAVQVGDQTLRPIAEIRLDQEDPFFTNLRDLLSQFGGVELLQSTGNTLDRPEVRQFIRDEFPELARELFGGFAAGAVGESGRTLGNAQQTQQLLFSQLQSRNAGGSEQEVPVTFDSAGNLIDAAEALETAADVIQEALPGSEAGAGAAAERQGRAERDILGTNVGRAQLNLGQSTDEGDFEGDRQALIGTINAVHAAEAARIDALILGETALKALRDANDLDRDIALLRATTAENTFTTQRIQNEMDVADAAADAAQAKIDGIEESAAAAMEAAEAEATATERQSTADSNAQRSLLGTGVSSAVFDLRESGSEGEFEANRQRAILLTVAYYAAENERINGLKGSETELAALRDANDLARRIALGRLTGLENTFTTQRIKNEMSVADAATEAAEAAIAATEKRAAAAMKAAEAEAEAQRRAAEAAEVAAERQRGRESDAAAGLLQTGVGQARFDLGLSGSEGEFEINRQGLIDAANAYYDNELARINELGLTEIELDDRRTANELKRQQALSRAITLTNSFTTARLRAEQDAFDEIEDLRDEAIDAEMDRQRAIDNLRDDALENQRDRADALVDLEQDTQDRLQDIRLNANRSREDIEQDYQDAYQDIQRQRVFENLSDDESVSQLTELGRERNRDLRDVDTRSGRRREDVGIRQGRQTEGINTEAQEQLTEIQIQTAALQSLTAITESETAMMNTGLLETQSQTAITASATAMTDSETAALNATTVGSFDTGVVAFGIGTETLAAAALELSELDLGDFAGALQELPLSLDVLTETLEALPSRLDEVFSTNFNILPSLLASYLQTSPTGNAPGTGTGSGGAGRTGDGEVVIDVTLNNMLTLPDGATAELGSNQHRLRAQRRSS